MPLPAGELTVAANETLFELDFNFAPSLSHVSLTRISLAKNFQSHLSIPSLSIRSQIFDYRSLTGAALGIFAGSFLSEGVEEIADHLYTGRFS